MNKYTTNFFAVCPNNGIRIGYELTITTGRVIHVEDIVAEVEAMLAARDAVWGNQLAILTQALTDALKAPPAPRRPVAIKFKFERGAIVGADLIPVE